MAGYLFDYFAPTRSSTTRGLLSSRGGTGTLDGEDPYGTSQGLLGGVPSLNDLVERNDLIGGIEEERGLPPDDRGVGTTGGAEADAYFSRTPQDFQASVYDRPAFGAPSAPGPAPQGGQGGGGP